MAKSGEMQCRLETYVFVYIITSMQSFSSTLKKISEDRNPFKAYIGMCYLPVS